MTKKIYFPIISFILFSGFLDGAFQDTRTHRFIKALEANGMIQEAITEYNRVLLIYPLTSEERGILWLKLAIDYRSLNSEAEMMKSFNQSIKYLKDSPHINRVYEEIGVFFLSRGKSEWARKILKQMSCESNENQIRYIALSYLIDENWEQFFRLLDKTGYSREAILDINRIVKRIQLNNRRFKTLDIIVKIIPGLGYLFYDDVFITGETLLFHGFFISQIFIETSIIGKFIYGFGLVRMYLRTTVRDHRFLKKKLGEKKLLLEKMIFHKLFDGNQS